MIDAFVDGTVTLNENNVITHHLTFPIGDDGSIATLDFVPRIAVGTLHKHLKGVSAGNADGRILAYISALTNKPSGLIGKMDTEDYSIASSIAIFFF